jgi:hypothetical protein
LSVLNEELSDYTPDHFSFLSLVVVPDFPEKDSGRGGPGGKLPGSIEDEEVILL